MPVPASAARAARDRLRVPAGGDLDLDPPVAVAERVGDPAAERPGRTVGRDAERHAADDPRRRRDAQPLGEQRGEPEAAAMRLEIPGRGLERRAGERIAADALAQQRVHRLGPLELAVEQARDQELRQQQPRGAERLLGVERQLERRGLAVAHVAVGVVEHHDERAADGHGAAADRERLAEGEGELVEVDVGQAHSQDGEGGEDGEDGAGDWARVQPLSSRAQRGILVAAFEPFPGKIPRCARDDRSATFHLQHHSAHHHAPPPHTSRNLSSPPLRCSTPSRSSSSMPATKPSAG